MTGAQLVDDGADRTERMGADDMATRREAEFLAAALRRQALVGSAAVYARGVCANCGVVCQPLAVYCDAECKAEHEARLQVLARQGRGGCSR